VSLAESLGPALRRRDVRGGARSLWANLLARPDKAAILRRAGHHVRSRRRREVRSRARRSEDEQLNAWLADY
jgi:hypothetical protein